MKVQILKDGPKNLTILVKGIVTDDFGPEEVLDLDKIEGPSNGWKGLRLDSALWLVQEKMTLTLWWEKDPKKEENLALIMESRNGARFDEQIPSPRFKDDWQGKIYLIGHRNSADPKAFMFILDFDKQ